MRILPRRGTTCRHRNRVSDAGGNSVQTSNTTLDITATSLTDTTPVTTLNALAGGTGPIVLATFTDGNPFADPEFFNPVVNWGGAVTGTPAVAGRARLRGARTTPPGTSLAMPRTPRREPTLRTITVSDAIGNTVQAADTTIDVTEAELTDTTPVSGVNATEGSSTGNVVLATFTDGNPNADPSYFTPVVNWGGTVIGNPSLSVQMVAQGTDNSTWEIVGNATYSAAGNYATTVTVNDADGSSVQTGNTSFQVADAPLTDTTPVAIVNAVAGSGTGPVVLATFTDGNPYAQSSDFTPIVNWGGTVVGAPAVSVQLVSQGTSCSTWEVVGNATYTESGNYATTVTVNDAGGNSVQTGNTSFHIADAQLTDTTPVAAVNAVEGSSSGPVRTGHVHRRQSGYAKS